MIPFTDSQFLWCGGKKPVLSRLKSSGDLANTTPSRLVAGFVGRCYKTGRGTDVRPTNLKMSARISSLSVSRNQGVPFGGVAASLWVEVEINAASELIEIGVIGKAHIAVVVGRIEA